MQSMLVLGLDLHQEKIFPIKGIIEIIAETSYELKITKYINCKFPENITVVIKRERPHAQENTQVISIQR